MTRERDGVWLDSLHGVMLVIVAILLAAVLGFTVTRFSDTAFGFVVVAACWFLAGLGCTYLMFRSNPREGFRALASSALAGIFVGGLFGLTFDSLASTFGKPSHVLVPWLLTGLAVPAGSFVAALALRLRAKDPAPLA